MKNQNNNKNFVQETPIVFSAKGVEITLDDTDLYFLSSLVKNRPEKTARFLIHGSPDSELHEMVIGHAEMKYIRPHINENSFKSFTVLSGSMAVITFGASGVISKIFHLKEVGKGESFILRLNEPIFHTILSLEGTVIFIETTLGPHLTTRYAEFAPVPNDDAAVEKYLDFLKTAILQRTS
jgi:cupin fold WbuC family metalloprotein